MRLRVQQAARWTACLLLLPALVLGQETPTVRGNDRRPTRPVTLAGQRGIPLQRALVVDFDGECLEEHTALAHTVERWLETPRVSERVSISVTGTETPVLGARFWLLVDGERASVRRFEDFSGNCEELAGALAASIALAIEAVDFDQYPELKPLPVQPVAKLTARSSLAPETPKSRPIQRPLRPGIVQSTTMGGHILAGVGAGPGNTFGGGVRGELGFRYGLNLRLSANYLETDAVRLSDGTLSTRSWGGQLGACWGGETLSYRAQVCVDTWLAAMTGHPKQLERAQDQTLPWFGVAPGAEVRFQHDSGSSVRFGALLMFNLVRPRFEVLLNTRDELLDAQLVPPLGFLGTLGLDWIAL